MVTKRPSSLGHTVKRYSVVGHGLLHDDDGPVVYFKDYQALLTERELLERQLNNLAAASQHLDAQAEGVQSFLEYCRKLASDYPTSMVAKSLEVIELNAEFHISQLRDQATETDQEVQ
ncbi:hypothetical protein [Candidatus Pantoea multigeneris]|uniref:Uncharacterized protein n=1 Tax=Candidatus Pantoea multigeneris TaxID=2608357 RepID=A0ABX0R7B6_9GAMM|nr:hypothetical protein [Pantoea multigeneris]NIF20293.1 hypothetical protein [Pantoea multigeneris]